MRILAEARPGSFPRRDASELIARRGSFLSPPPSPEFHPVFRWRVSSARWLTGILSPIVFPYRPFLAAFPRPDARCIPRPSSANLPR